jgi:3-hydroxyisobutyrate dehydrogenase
MQVAVLGTGIMGAGMAQSLLRAGHQVRVWNRTRDKAEPLKQQGATLADDAQDAVRGAEAVITMLFDADAVLEVMAGIDLPEGCVWVQSSTIGIEGMRQVVEHARQRDLRVLDAPVLGTKTPAAEGKLVVLVSGQQQVVAQMQPVFEAVGGKTVHAGAEPGAATALKLVCNAWIGALTAALGQSVALADGLGLDPRLFLEAIDGGPVDAPYVHLKSGAMLADDYPTSFAVDGVVKDLDLISAAAAQAGVTDAMLTAIREMFVRTSAAGRGADDMAAVYTAFRQAARPSHR